MSSNNATDNAGIAVIGFACRLPGAGNPAEFWELLSSGTSAISSWPDDRAAYAGAGDRPERRGAFLADIEGFDAPFFGISPREAAAMDPRQRLVLELAWEALEDAGARPEQLRGGDTAVLVGTHRDDYAALLGTLPADAITHHSLTGASRGVIANRVSYFLGVRGPSLTVDSVQSSALVAVHLACQSLRAGEASTALVAGVNLNLSAATAVATERFGGLSPTGTSAAFDASADGFVRGEGAVALLLKPLADAIAAGDRVHGVIHGSAVNNDGATEGLTVPGRAAQEQVLREAYRRAGVSTAQVQYVETHGTGTPVGDPIEAAALGAVLGSGRTRPLPIGSVKTNIGHLEGAAGLAGLLKVLLCLRNRQLPPSLNFSDPNPAIPFGELNLAVQTELSEWPEPTAPLLAGVSSFGMGGTNCHLVVGEAPEREPVTAAGRTLAVVPWVLSARTPEALASQAKRLAELASPDLADVGWSLATTRTTFDHRAVVAAGDGPARQRALEALAAGLPAPQLVTGSVEPGESAVVFSGQGGQRIGMGQELYREFPVFAAEFDAIAAHLDPVLDRPLRDLIATGVDLDETGYAQPALFAVQVALYRLVESWGIAPDFVAGHSIGEIAAAHVAGVLSRADAATLVAARGRLMQALPSGGAMIALEATEDEVAPLLAGLPELGIAAVNGPRAVVIAGSEHGAVEVAARVSAMGRKTKRLKVSHAFHSPLMEPMLDEFAAVVRTLTFAQPTLRAVSSVTGGPAQEWASADYWVQHIRQPVRFMDAVRALETYGVRQVFELGPDGVCSAMIADAAVDAERITAVPALRPGRDEPVTIVTAAGQLFTRGARIDWPALFSGSGARVVDLPTYPFQRRRYPLLGGASVPAVAPATAAPAPAEVAAAAPAVADIDVDALVTGHIRAVLGFDATERVDVHARFRDLGFDSLLGVELRKALARATDLSLPGGLLFDYPTPAALIDYLNAALTGTANDGAAEAFTAAGNEPIAIVGMACRYPGGIAGPDDLWRVVADGIDAITEFPADRGWDEALFAGDRPGGSYVRVGGFLDHADEFDAGLFGISPREALAMDPQQRLLLETSWEAIEHASIDPQSLAGSRTGVFVGATVSDYGPRMHTPTAGTEGYVLTGTANSVMSGRIAYQLGLLGPALTVDTACSSSLVAIHLAMRSLRAGESALALAGGAAVMANPGMFVEFSRQRGLAPDGRCKPFAAAADGTAWAEGAGVLLLERLSDARRNGHRVLGVIRGTAINQDGASNGLTAPNGPAQRRVIGAALADAGLTAGAVDAVEAHGTGTALGDPIEADALLATYGAQRDSGRPLYLGSLKSNIGHAQAAAGVAGVIKMVQAMRHGVLPGTLHLDAPTPHVDWSAGSIELLAQRRDWPRGAHPRRAGVSSFGISGTNAHLVLEEGESVSPAAAFPADTSDPTRTVVAAAAQTEAGVAASAPTTSTSAGSENALSVAPSGAAAFAGGAVARPVAWLVSGRDRQALRAQAGKLDEFLAARPEASIGAFADSLVRTRALLPERAVVVGRTHADFRSGLAALRDGTAAPQLVSGRAARAVRTAFLFTGQGAQRLGMGQELHAAFPAFAAAFDEVCAAFDPWLALPLREIVRDNIDALDRTEYTQPALFAVEVALAALCRELGLIPDAVAGHSIGELAALHVAGGIGLADAAKLVAARGRLMQAARAGGAMIAIGAPADEVAASLDGHAVDIAAVNGLASVVISGDTDAAEAVAERWRAAGHRTHTLRVSHAFHSAHMDSALAELRAVAESVSFTDPVIPVVSALSPERADLTSPDYWVRQLRGTVRFLDAVRRLEDDDIRLFVEIGPDAVLTAMARESFATPASIAVPLLRRGRPEADTFVTGLATAHVHGAPADLTALVESSSATVELPTYAFQRGSYWLRGGTERPAAGHPILTTRVDRADRDEVLFSGTLTTAEHGWLRDHVIAGAPILPAAAFVDFAVAAANLLGAEQVSEVVVEAALPLDGSVEVQLIAGAARANERRPFTIHARTAEDAPWSRHASGFFDLAAAPAPGLGDEWPAPDAVEEPIEHAYDRLAGLGYQYGAAFRGLTRWWRTDDALFAEVRLPDARIDEAGRYGLHPALLDAVLHPLVLDLADAAGPREMLLPYAFSAVRVSLPGTSSLRARLIRTGRTSAEITVTTDDGTPVAVIGALDFRPTAVEGLVARPPLYALAWQPLHESESTGTEVETLVLGPGDTPEQVHAATILATESIQRHLAEASSPLVLVTRGAVATAAGERVDDLAGAAVWGLARVAAGEHPGRVLVLDIPAQDEIGEWPNRAAASGEAQLAVRDGALHIPRVATRTAEFTGTPIRTDGTALITGGTGGLGALFARHLVAEHGVRHLLLVSRRGPATPGAEDLTADLRAAGATVEVLAADMADPNAVAGVLAAIPADRPLRAVVHAAGTLADAMIDTLTAEQIHTVLRPKVDAAWQLHRATADLDLDAFILFSSLSGTIGTAGQGNYAAANAYLDGLAAHRAASGLPARSLAWGLWDTSVGMGTGLSAADIERWKRLGAPPLPVETGLALFDTALGSPEPVVVAATIDYGVPAAAAPAILRAPVRRGNRTAGGTWADRMTALADDRRADALLEYVLSVSAAVLGHDSASGLDADSAFRELGFDSLAGLELRNRIGAETGFTLGATVVFDHPSPTALATHLGELLRPKQPAAATVAVKARTAQDDPIVIVGMACRYPGDVRTPGHLWQLVADGVDAIGEFPVNRGWNVDELYDPRSERPGTSSTKNGGFLYDADLFDADFFGISPREATATDPQQRLLLETAWEAMEYAAIDPATLRGSRTGVFTGAMYDDYAIRVQGAAGEFEGLLLAGNLSSVISGRLAYTFGFEGPAITVDTACSSSLVAMHLAAQSLRSGECDLAVAGGVTVMSTPNTFVEFSRQRGLSADGRCKAFGADADGTGWSEGVGLVVLQRLSDARAAGHEVLAVLRGTAVNQDGASNGLTAPSGPAQERVIRAALADAGLSAAEVDAVEAHGTGTRLGDPIEAQALLATYGSDRADDRPLWLGSLKSNIGHSQAASGVGGVIKMIEAMRRGVLPRTLHAETPSPHVDWASGAVRLLTEARPWPETGQPRRAGVSSFGVSGTNAHVILEQPAPRTAVAVAPEQPVPWILSAKDDAGLREVAARLRDHLAETDARPADIGLTLATGRARHDVRAAITGEPAELARALDDIAEDRPNTAVARARRGSRGKLGMLFTGQGSQRLGMGRELYETSPVFAGVFDEICALLDPGLARPLREVLFAPEDSADSALLDQTHFAQAALFAVETALYRTVESHGLRPDYLTGHSIGEVAAAHAAGVLDLADAATLVSARGRLMQAARSHGAMIAVEATEAELAPDLAGYGDAVVIAAINGPRSTVISGDADAAAAVAELWRERGRKVRQLPVSHAFHSPHMDDVLDEFHRAIAHLDFRPPSIPLVSNVTGTLATVEEVTDPGYWVRHIRLAVRFLDGIRYLESAGVTDFVEIGPDGVLSALAQQTLTATDGFAAPVLRRGRSERQALTAAVAIAGMRGHRVDWDSLYTGARRVAAPTYPFQHKRYWLEPAGRTPNLAGVGLGAADHELLGAAVPIANRDEVRFTTRLGVESAPWLADHALDGLPVVAGTALVDMILHAAGRVGCDELAELTIGAPLVLPPGGTTVQVGIGLPDELGRRAAEVHSRRTDDGEWVAHAGGFVVARTEDRAAGTVGAIDDSEFDLTGVYERLHDLGYQYGPAFQGLKRVRRTDESLFVAVELPEARHGDHVDLHPALLDAALHALLPGVTGESARSWLPFAWSGVRIHATGATALRVRIDVEDAGTDALRVSLHADDPAGAPVATVDSLVLRARTAVTAAIEVDGLLVPRLRPVRTEGDGVGVQIIEAPTGSPKAVLHATLETVRDWLAQSEGERLAIVTAAGELGHAGIRGLVRSAEAENPGRVTVVEIDESERSRDVLDRAAATGEPHVVVRDGELFAPRLERMRQVAGETPDWSRGTVLITGGTGTLGALLARHLVAEHGARDLLLLSRRGPAAPGAAELSSELAEFGARVAIVAADVTDRDALAAAIGDRTIGAVVHTAGLTEDGVVTALTREQLDRVLRPKLDAAWHLHELTLAHRPAAFVLYSSVAGLLGTAGQANYAAANTYLDGLAEHRQAQGLPATSLAWGLWAGSSELSGHLEDVDLRRLARSGLLPLDPAAALDLFDAAVRTGEPVLAVTRIDQEALRANESGVPAPLRDLVRTKARRAAALASTAPDPTARLAGLDPDARIQALADLVRARAAAALGHDDDSAVTRDRSFQELGFDSLMAVELRNDLGKALGLALPATLIFDHANPAALAEHLAGQLGFDTGTTEVPVLELIDGLRPSITAALTDTGQAAAIAARLRELLSLVTADTGFEGDLDAATDDELYALIDELD
ncbi:type I polyketide synthase [Nocardia sp. NPDC005746]|uniref:type I polyketide synthase n=1 Tax=Nocardia sp. NPDC005746 TaxID=3157062 RepID=UPI0033D5D4D3